MPLDRTANRSPSPISATSISSSSSSSSRSLTSPSPSPSSTSSSTSSTQPRAATWIPDSAVSACHSCKATFTLTRRRHHCRSCGNIFCNACSLSRSTLPTHPTPVRVCQPCHQFELSRQKFTSHECDMLVKGHIFLKHANGVGCARYRWIKLSPDHQSIYWHPDNAPCKPNSTIYLSEIMEIREGQTTASFKRTGKCGREHLCFSIVTKARTLDLETEDQIVRDTWVSALKNALLHVNKLSPAEMKRREQLHLDRVRAQQQAIEQQQQIQQEKQQKIQQRTERIQGIRQKYQTTR